jgi:hypothetical protein
MFDRVFAFSYRACRRNDRLQSGTYRRREISNRNWVTSPANAPPLTVPPTDLHDPAKSLIEVSSPSTEDCINPYDHRLAQTKPVQNIRESGKFDRAGEEFYQTSCKLYRPRFKFYRKTDKVYRWARIFYRKSVGVNRRIGPIDAGSTLTACFVPHRVSFSVGTALAASAVQLSQPETITIPCVGFYLLRRRIVGRTFAAKAAPTTTTFVVRLETALRDEVHDDRTSPVTRDPISHRHG